MFEFDLLNNKEERRIFYYETSAYWTQITYQWKFLFKTFKNYFDCE